MIFEMSTLSRLRRNVLLLLGLAVMILSMPPISAGATDVALSINEAVSHAQAADIDYQIALLTWENAQIDQTIAQASGDMTPYELLQQDLRTGRAEHAFRQAHINLVLGVISDYLGVKQTATQLEIARRELAVAEIEVERTEELIRIGNATEQDRLRETNRLVNAKLSLASATRTYDNRVNGLLRRLGLRENTTVTLVDQLEIIPFTYTLENTLRLAREASFEVWERSVNMQLAEWDLENLRSQNTAPLTLQKAENEFKIQQLNAEKSEAQFVAQTTITFHNVHDAWIRLENAERDYQVAENNYQQQVRQYESGLRTNHDLDLAWIEWTRASQSFEDAKNDYALSYLEFQVLLGHPLPFGEEGLR